MDWLWNPLDSFVICLCSFFGPDRAQRSIARIPIILKLLRTNRNIALIYSVAIWEQKTKDCALHGHQGASNINYSTVVSALMFAGFHNQSPLLTMVWGKLKCVLQWNLDITKGLGTGNICSPQRDFFMSRFSLFHMFYYYSGGEEMCFVMPKTSLYKGSLN